MKAKVEYKLHQMEPRKIGRHFWTHVIEIRRGQKASAIGYGRYIWKAQESKTYAPNGEREKARRLRQMARDGVKGASVTTMKIDNVDGYQVRHFVEDSA